MAVIFAARCGVCNDFDYSFGATTMVSDSSVLPRLSTIDEDEESCLFSASILSTTIDGDISSETLSTFEWTKNCGVLLSDLSAGR